MVVLSEYHHQSHKLIAEMCRAVEILNLIPISYCLGLILSRKPCCFAFHTTGTVDLRRKIDQSFSFLFRYANRAKNIKNKPKINEDPKDALLREFQEEISR